MTAAPARSREGSDLALVLLLAGVTVAGLLWLGGAGYFVLSGRPVPHGRALAGLAALAHPADPALAWGARKGSPASYWAVSAGACLAGAGAAWLALRLWRAFEPGRPGEDPHRLPGLASRRQVEAVAGRKALVAKATVLRPSLSKPQAADVGFRLGRSRGTGCWASVRDSTVVLGPPGAGKGLHLVVPMVLDAPGPVVTTSTRPDNLAIALAARGRRGAVAVFDPQGLAAGAPSGAKWSPVSGCERPRVAMARALALVGNSARGTDNSTFWAQQTVQVTRCLLHAAALAGRGPLDLYRWSLSPANAMEAVEVLRENPRAGTAWGRALDAIVSAERRTRDSVWAMVSNTFASLADPAVLEAVSPEPADGFEPEAFLRSGGTLFLLGTASGASAASGLVAALVEDVVDVARRLAAASPGARLDPPLTLVLDEAANYPLPSLSSLMSEGGGTGICTVAVLQSLAQARDRWGREAAQVIWDAATVKVVLGGQASADDLADISKLLGEVEVEETSQSFGRGGERVVSVARRQKPVLEPARLRTLPFGTGVLLLRSAPPVLLDLQAWTERPDAKMLQAEREALEAALRSGASGGQRA